FQYKVERNDLYIKAQRIQKIMDIRNKRKLLHSLKRHTFLEKTPVYEQRIKLKTEDDLNKLEEGMKKHKEDLWTLIMKAEEKLKHENRKKVQAKLKLDQIVLRGISALNLQALALSQNSLKGNDVLFIL